MTLFDLLFIAIVFASVVILLTIIYRLLRGHIKRAFNLLKMYGMFLLIYLCTVICVSIFSPQKVLAIGENKYSDDLGIAIDGITHSDMDVKDIYTLSINLSSRAKSRSQREIGIVVYMTDENGRRYDSFNDASEAPFDVMLNPGQSVITTRKFDLTGSTGKPAVVICKEGINRFPGIFIIGDESSLFHKPVIFPVQ